MLQIKIKSVKKDSETKPKPQQAKVSLVSQEFMTHMESYTNLINGIIRIIWKYLSGEELFSRTKIPTVLEAWESTFLPDFLEFEGPELILQLQERWNGFFLDTEVEVYSQKISMITQSTPNNVRMISQFVIDDFDCKDFEAYSVRNRCFYIIFFFIKRLGRLLAFSDESTHYYIGNGPNDLHSFARKFSLFISIQIEYLNRCIDHSSELNRPKIKALILILAWMESDEVWDLLSSYFEWGDCVSEFSGEYLTLPRMKPKLDQLALFYLKREHNPEFLSLSSINYFASINYFEFV